MLIDRLAERASLGRLLDAAKGGYSAVLVIRGAPGVGKTALLDHSVESGGALAGLPELAVGGLGVGDAQALLAWVASGPVDERVRDRVVAETHGNPLALLELLRGPSLTQFSGGFDEDGVAGVPRRIEQSFQRRVESLPMDTQRLVLLAAAEPTGNPLLLWRAAGLLGIGTQALAAAEEAGLMMIGC